MVTSCHVAHFSWDMKHMSVQDRALHWVPIPMPMPMPTHAHGFWVGMGAILLFMGGHGFDIIFHGWAWAKAKHIGRGHWMSSHSMLSRVRAPNHLHPVRWVHPSVCLLLVLLLLLLECVPGLPRILGIFFVTILCLCFSHPTLNPILPRGFQNSRNRGCCKVVGSERKKCREYANQEALRAEANDSERPFICPIQPRLGVGG